MKTKDLALIGILASLAIILSLMEAALFPTFVLGIKAGLANIITIIGIYFLNFRKLLAIALVRTFISSLLLGKFLSLGYFLSLSGAIMSLISIFFIYYLFKDSSPIFLSIIGSITHNVSQLLVAYFVVGYGFFYYLPYLVFFAIPTGIITGLIAKGVLNSLEFFSRVIK